MELTKHFQILIPIVFLFTLANGQSIIQPYFNNKKADQPYDYIFIPRQEIELQPNDLPSQTQGQIQGQSNRIQNPSQIILRIAPVENIKPNEYSEFYQPLTARSGLVANNPTGRIWTRSVDDKCMAICRSKNIPQTTSLKNSYDGDQITTPTYNNNREEHDRNSPKTEFANEMLKAVQNELVNFMRNVSEDGSSSNRGKNISLDMSKVQKILDKYIPEAQQVFESGKINSPDYKKMERTGSQALDSFARPLYRNLINGTKQFFNPSSSNPSPQNDAKWDPITGNNESPNYRNWWTSARNFANNLRQPENIVNKLHSMTNSGRTGYLNDNLSGRSDEKLRDFNINFPTATNNRQPENFNYNSPRMMGNRVFGNSYDLSPTNVNGNLEYVPSYFSRNGQTGNTDYNSPSMNNNQKQGYSNNNFPSVNYNRQGNLNYSSLTMSSNRIYGNQYNSPPKNSYGNPKSIPPLVFRNGQPESVNYNPSSMIGREKLRKPENFPPANNNKQSENMNYAPQHMTSGFSNRPHNIPPTNNMGNSKYIPPIVFQNGQPEYVNYIPSSMVSGEKPGNTGNFPPASNNRQPGNLIYNSQQVTAPVFNNGPSGIPYNIPPTNSNGNSKYIPPSVSNNGNMNYNFSHANGNGQSENPHRTFPPLVNRPDNSNYNLPSANMKGTPRSQNFNFQSTSINGQAGILHYSYVPKMNAGQANNLKNNDPPTSFARFGSSMGQWTSNGPLTNSGPTVLNSPIPSSELNSPSNNNYRNFIYVPQEQVFNSQPNSYGYNGSVHRYQVPP